MNIIKRFFLLFALLTVVPCLAQQQSDNKGIEFVTVNDNRIICISSMVEDTSKIIKNPGNCPIEILRRLGRVLAKKWPEREKILKYGTIILNEFVGTPKYLKSIPEKYLSDSQKKACDDLINNHSEAFKKLNSEFIASSEAITVKIAFNMSEIKDSLKKLIEPNNNLPAISPQEVSKLKDTFIPILDNFSDTYGILSISENGIFGRANLDSKEGRFAELIPLKNLTINKYIDEEPLIILAQTHGKEEPAMVMKKLDDIPNMSVVRQIIASAGLDFEKDIINNYTQESILYINLTPTGEKLIPDVRWVAMVPTIDNLIEILPKLQNLCIQTGIFVTKVESPLKDVALIKLSHFMTNGYGVYASIFDKFCILSSTLEGNVSAITHLKNLPKVSKEDKIKDSNLYFRIKTSDLNVQLQQFLQSPLLRNQKIPPITNLTFLNDMNDITAYTKVSNNKLELILDIPFYLKKNNN